MAHSVKFRKVGKFGRLLDRLLDTSMFHVQCCLSSNQIYKDVARSLLDQGPHIEDVRYDSYRLRSACLGSRFSEAHIEAVQLLIDRNTRSVVEPEQIFNGDVPKSCVLKPSQSFKTLYRRGFTFLERVGALGLGAVTSESPVPAEEIDREQAFFALTALTHFLADIERHEESVKQTLNGMLKEDEIRVIMANHLLAQLSSSRRFFISEDVEYKSTMCPCRMKHCNDITEYQRAGLGSVHLWYGFPDLVLNPTDKHNISCPVIFSQSAHELEMEAEIEDICEEERQQNKFRYLSPQCIAQAVTFSVYKSVKCRSKSPISDVTLVPTIAMTPEWFDVWLYDSKYDVLLRNSGDPIPLWWPSPRGVSFDKLRLSSVLQLWMLLNYNIFGTKISLRNEAINSCQLQERIGRERMTLICEDIGVKSSFRVPRVDELNDGDVEHVDILEGGEL